MMYYMYTMICQTFIHLQITAALYNGTTEITVTLAVIDEGVPPRGSAINVTVNISNTCLLNEQFEKTNFTFSV
jgi:hypothetical protein